MPDIAMDNGGSPISWLEIVLIVILLILVFASLNSLLRPYINTVILPRLCAQYGLFCPGG
jgi:hypothetical protein